MACVACGAAPADLPASARPWQKDVVYQIYPRSFADSDGDGLGDLQGIIGKLDYLKNLGINAVWLSPVYRTTNYDNGYDITDYLDIDPLFGSLGEWQAMLDGLHQRQIKLIMDLVVNHSSDEHPWFVQEVRAKSLQRTLAAKAPPPNTTPETFAQTMRRILCETPVEPESWPDGAYASAAAAVLAFRSTSEHARQAGYYSAQVQLERLATALYPVPGEVQAAPHTYDYYIWRDQPSNWRSCFSGPAWHLQPGVGSSYLALFSAHQPDLNWVNPDLRAAVHHVVRTWVSRGVDGLRLDVIDLIGKNMDFPDVPVVEGERWGAAEAHFTDLPATHAYLQEMVDSALNPNIRTVGELAGVGPEALLDYTDPERQELNEGFLFTHMEADFAGPKYAPHAFALDKLRTALTQQQLTVHGHGWLANYLENHDRLRAVSRFANDSTYRELSAKMLGTLLFTLEGSPYIYQGQELGMTNATFNSIDEVHDVEAIGYYDGALQAGIDGATAMDLVSKNTRDNARTAMQWDATPNAGFTTGRPWIKVNPNYAEINAAKALQDPRSTLAFYQRLIKMREHSDVLLYGAYRPLLEEHPHVLAYARELGGDRVWVMLNFSSSPQAAQVPVAPGARLLLDTYPEPARDAAVPLRPYEGRVYSSF